MSIKNMIRSGLHITQAQAIGGVTDGSCTLAAAGSTWATATRITAPVVYVTSAQDGTTGIALPATGAYDVGDEWWIWSKDDSGSSACILYPPSGGVINNGSANATFSITDQKLCHVKCVAAGTYVASISA